MMSVLAQERLLGAALGAVFAGVYVFEQRKCIYRSIAESQSHLYPQYQLKEPVRIRKSQLDLAHLWNKAVDKSLGPGIEYLSLRGW